MHKKIAKIAAFTAAALLLGASLVLAADFSPSTQTTDATPVIPSGGPTVSPDALCRVTMSVFASDHGGNVAFWEWRILARRVNDGAPTMLFAAPIPAQKTLGAASWLAQPIVTDERIQVQIQGGLTQTVDWLVLNDDIFCMAGPLP